MTWLVEIQVKTWRHDLPNHGKIVAFVEVEVFGYSSIVKPDRLKALDKGFERFVEKSHYERSIRRHLESLGVTTMDCFAADAVQL